MRNVHYQFQAVARSAAQERRYVYAIIFLAVGLGAVPILLGYQHTPKGSQFLGQIFIIDDYCVYLSWTKQALDGHFHIRNLFTTDPQKGLEFNLFFLALGYLTNLTGTSIDIVWQVARVMGAIGMFLVIRQLYAHVLPIDRAARTVGLAFAALGSGLAWLHYLKDQNPRLIYPSADSAQPEAFTFDAAYYSPLMSLGLILICASLLLLSQMIAKRQARYAIGAGLALLLLGNVHSYDVIHVAAVWIAFLICYTVSRRRMDWYALSMSIVAGVIALPSVLYQYYVLKHETVFYQRAMETFTRTPEPTFYLMGYGFILILALIGVRIALFQAAKRDPGQRLPEVDPKLLLMICWAVTALILVYAVPLPFQRKLIMGEDIPLSLLAAIGATSITAMLRPFTRRLALAAIVAATVPSTLLFVWRDIDTVGHAKDIAGSPSSPYLSPGEAATLKWIDTHSNRTDGFAAPIRLSLLIPGYCDRPVWAAHWSETPKCELKASEFSAAFSTSGSDASRMRFLKGAHVKYFCYPNSPKHLSLTEMTPGGVRRRYADIAHNPPADLRSVYRNSEYTVFLVPAP